MGDDPGVSLREEVTSLRRQVRILQLGLVAGAACLAAAAVAPAAKVLRARDLVIEDGIGRDRIVLGDAASGGSTATDAMSETLVFKGENGRERVVLGKEPGPRLQGQTYHRIAQGWGMLIYDPDGDERGGFNYLDGRGASISIDRPTGDAVGMLIDERSGLAKFVLNYDNQGKIDSSPTALEVSTTGDRASIEVSNRNGSPAGTLTASGQGKARLSLGPTTDAQ